MCMNNEISSKVKDGTNAHDVYDASHGKYAQRKPAVQPGGAKPIATSFAKGGK